MLAGIQPRVPAVHFEIFDVGPTVDPPSDLRSDAFLVASAGAADAGDRAGATAPLASLDIDASGRRWRIVARPGPAFVAGSDDRALPLLIAVGGGGLSLLATAFALVVMAGRVRRRREVFASYLDVTPDAVVVVAPDGSITHVNANAEEVFGYRGDELIGRPVEVLLPESARDVHVEHRSAYALEPTVRPMGAGRDLQGRRKDGVILDVDVRLAPVVTERGVGFAAALRDATERRTAERALADALERERVALEQLRIADRLKDEFLDITAHELRTPLMSISGFVDLLTRRGDEMDAARRSDLLARVSTNTDDMAEMVERLLNVSRLSAGRVQVKNEPVTLKPVVDAVVATLVPRLAGKRVVVDVPDDLEVVADEAGLTHVLGNLLSNAAKFTGPEGRVTVVAARSNGEVLVTVSDDGVGIAPEDLPRLFERFYQGSIQAENARGTGVGLSIVDRYLQLLHGSIAVESEPGRGSTFTVRLPEATSRRADKGGP